MILCRLLGDWNSRHEAYSGWLTVLTADILYACSYVGHAEPGTVVPLSQY
jgi:hypothetical protein